MGVWPSWMQWLSVVLSLVAIELMTGTSYLLMLAIGACAGALVAMAGAPIAIQIPIAALVGLVAVVVLHRKRSRADRS